MLKTETLELTEQWDKTFPQSDKVGHKKVTFVNRYGITLAADMYTPKNAEGRLPALAVSGPFGAVKEQCSGLYAQTMAERGYLTIAFDPSYTGESGGAPRYMASPDINTEDFMAAVDFLSAQDNVDADRIGVIGIFGWGGMALNAAALDTRVKATVAVTMYDMTRVTANGYFDSEDSEEARFEKKKALCALRTAEYKSGEYSRAGGCVPLPVPEDAPLFARRRLCAAARAGGRAVFRQGLQRILQGQGVPRKKPQLQRGLGKHRLHVVFQSADIEVFKRDPLGCYDRPRRQGAQLLFRQGRVRGDDARQ